MKNIILALVFLGAALMVKNILSFYKYMKKVGQYGDWEGNRSVLLVPFILIVMFLLGYITVGVLGDPDIVMALILFFGSVFVAIMVNMLENVTSHIQVTEQLQAELKAAEESSRAKTVFLSNMSHEIRTPMNAVIGITSIALRDPDISDETKDQIHKIDANSRHMLTLINDVLDMSNIESGQMMLQDEPFLLSDLLERVGGIIESQCEDKGLGFRQEIRGTAGCYMGDETRLEQVLINILDNSVKFTPAPGRVYFKTEISDIGDGRPELRFTISDTGIGIEEEYLPKIFDSFTLEDDSSTNIYGGMGLGMAITARIVELMGGDIHVESAKNVGTTFLVTVKLPECDADQIETAPVVSVESVRQMDEWFILFAEDVEINAEILADLLEIEDIRSDWAENGLVAVNKFKESEPWTYDAILMDMRMPVMDGLEATRTIRSMDRPDAKTIPIIALTANAFYSDAKECFEAGMNAHLPKPVDTERLLDTLSSLITG